MSHACGSRKILYYKILFRSVTFYMARSRLFQTSHFSPAADGIICDIAVSGFRPFCSIYIVLHHLQTEVIGSPALRSACVCVGQSLIRSHVGDNGIAQAVASGGCCRISVVRDEGHFFHNELLTCFSGVQPYKELFCQFFFFWSGESASNSDSMPKT